MPSSKSIAAHLPLLRRYARALTGSQGSGDAAVRATLEAIIQDPSMVGPNGNERVGLYRVFHIISKGQETHLKALRPSVPVRRDLSKHLRMLNPVPREALLLTMMEGFAPEEAATILGCSERDVEELVDVALTELNSPIPAPILIIEDETVISLDLSQLIAEMGHSVMAVARTRKEAVEAVRNNRPALILADVQLADDSSGIDAVDDILQKFDVPAVFVTAFPERLLTGERREPAYVITKPFIPANVKTVIGHALSLAESAPAA